MARLESFAELLQEYGQDAAWLCAEVGELGRDLGDHDQVERDVLRFLEASAPVATQLRSLRATPYALHILLELRTCSRYGFHLVVTNPNLFWGILERHDFGVVFRHRGYRDSLHEQLARLKHHEHRVNALVWFQKYHFLRLVIGDISESLGFNAIVCELSDLADVLIAAALDLAVDKLAPRYGRAQTPFTVCALGKLGARELNYSSDIDLLFLYGADGSTVDGERELEHHPYFLRLGAAIIEILGGHHDSGWLYRVDMRLRPNGAAGELANSLRAVRDYYYTMGRAWERQALLKLRPCAGAIELGEALLDELRPWMFPQEQRDQDPSETRSMRLRIEERARSGNLKTGAGGIRDIEFLAQYYQLRFGGRIPALRRCDTLSVLDALRRAGVLSQPAADALQRDYIWLRMIEHRLQMYESRQVHDVPDDATRRRHLARCCGYTGEDAVARFDAELAAVRERVRSLSREHYLDISDEEEAFGSFLAAPGLEAEAAVALLDPYGFADPARAAERLRMLSREPFFILSQSKTELELAALAPSLCIRLARTPDQDYSLHNFTRIAGSVGNRSLFYQRLRRWPRLLETFVELCGWATFIVGELVRHVGLPDEMVERMLLSGWEDVNYRAEAQGLVAGLGDPTAPLSYLKARESATIAIEDLHGAGQARVTRRLTRLATALIQVLLDRCIERRVARWGAPVQRDGAPCRFAVLGLGKLGSGELGYASDLDVLFVREGNGSCARNDARDAEAFYGRVARDLMGLAGDSKLADIDPRLRPWGEQGQLVVTLTTLERYWGDARPLWERMAMTRVAPIAGDPDLGQRAADLIRAAALQAPVPEDAAQQVRAMRGRLEGSVAGRDHVKRGPGGYVDLEFLAHYCCLGLDPTQLPAGASIAATIARLGQLGILSTLAVKECCGALRVLRGLEARMRLDAGHAISHLPTETGARARLARVAGYPDLASMDRELHLARERARAWFDRLVR